MIVVNGDSLRKISSLETNSFCLRHFMLYSFVNSLSANLHKLYGLASRILKRLASENVRNRLKSAITIKQEIRYLKKDGWRSCMDVHFVCNTCICCRKLH